MGITDYLNKTKKSGLTRRDNIELLRPIVNIFVGEFENDEKQILMETLSERVGNTRRIHYCEIKLKRSRAAVEGEEAKVYLFPCGVARVKQYDIGSWNTLLEQAKQSEQIKRDASDLVSYVYNEASSGVQYDAQGRIRLNYIIQADWIGAALLETLVDVFSASFRERYANGVDTDLYCLLDQKGYNNKEYGEERCALNYRTLTAINRVVVEKKLDPAYLLSNYVSQGHLEPDSLKERIETIALHMIIKDGKSAGDQQKRFLETNFVEADFVEAARGSGGQFCTIGKLNLKVDEELRDWVVYKTVFSDLHRSEDSGNGGRTERLIEEMKVDNEDEYEKDIGELFPHIEEKHFYPMIVDHQVMQSYLESESIESIVEKLYGQGLVYFLQENFQCSQEDKKELADRIVERINRTLSEAYRSGGSSLGEVCKAAEKAEQKFREYVGYYRQRSQDERAGFESWKRQRYGGRDVLHNCYTLAYQYFGQYAKAKYVEVYKEVAENCLKEIRISADYYREQFNTVEEALQELIEGIAEKERDTDRLLCGNMDRYYTEAAIEWMKENADEYGNFFEMINNQICNRELRGESIYQEVIRFCDENIIQKDGSRYPSDIAEEMTRRLLNYENLTTKEAIYGLAFDTIMGKRKCFAKHTKFGRPYEAVCFLINPSNDFVNSAPALKNEKEWDQELRWFFEEHYSGMDILFLEGCFEVSDIYHYDLYKRVDERFEKTESSPKNDKVEG